MLKGERVILRPIEREDQDRLWELLETIEVKSLQTDRPVILKSRAEFAAEYEQQPATGPADQLWYGVEVDGDLIGTCGLHHIDHFAGLADLGIGLGQEYWGKGYGQDAIRTIVAYAFRHMNIRKVALEVLADDERAVGAYRRAGFVEEGRLRQQSWYDGAFRDTLRMAVLRDEWPGAARPSVG